MKAQKIFKVYGVATTNDVEGHDMMIQYLEVSNLSRNLKKNVETVRIWELGSNMA